MCQLTLAKADNLKLLKVMLTTVPVVNTERTHLDGCGMHVIKKKGEAYNIRSLVPPSKSKSFVKEFVSEVTNPHYPVLFHVRRASTKTTDIKSDHLHPFFDENTGMVFAHNGTLEYQDGDTQREKEKEFPDYIDSQIFFHELTNQYQELKGDMVKALQESMKLFAGKFAFLIKDNDSNFYIVRGKADLHVAEFRQGDKHIGLLVNTEEDSLNKGVTFIQNYIELDGVECDVEVSKLKEETIYKLDGYKLIELGEIKQNVKTYQYNRKKDWNSQYPANRTLASPAPQGQDVTSVPTRSNVGEGVSTKIFNIIDNICAEFNLSIQEFDELLFSTLGVSLCEITLADIRLFNTTVIRVLRRVKQSKGGVFKQASKMWGNACRDSLVYSPILLYNKSPENATQFPFFLSSHHELKALEDQMKKVKEKRSK